MLILKKIDFVIVTNTRYYYRLQTILIRSQFSEKTVKRHRVRKPLVFLSIRFGGTAEPGGLPCMGSHRHDWSDLAAAAGAAGLVSSIQIYTLLFVYRSNIEPV